MESSLQRGTGWGDAVQVLCPADHPPACSCSPTPDSAAGKQAGPGEDLGRYKDLGCQCLNDGQPESRKQRKGQLGGHGDGKKKAFSLGPLCFN